MEGAQYDAQLCKQCRGRCCQGHPGLWSEPERFWRIFFAGRIPTAQELVGLLRQRSLALRDVGGVLIPAPTESEQGCTAQRENGCAFTTSERPCQCLALIPNLETLLDDLIHCTLPPEYGSGAARCHWRPFQPLLHQAQRLLV
ncbi:MAG: hypothetical protein JXR59_10595 [Desulfuromonadaceae bacterium]|nr:hypothetical protein [Desulfuromonadaceae bacterium]